VRVTLLGLELDIVASLHVQDPPPAEIRRPRLTPLTLGYWDADGALIAPAPVTDPPMFDVERYAYWGAGIYRRVL
jgi:hypothetical protein